jgi:hypothetical protein
MPTQTYLSLAEFPGDGVTTEWDFNFAGGYINRAHVKAWTQDPQGVVTAHVIEPGDFITDFRVTISPPVPAGHLLRIYRETPREEPLVNFTGGSNFTEANLDLLAKQAIFCAAEAFDTGAYILAVDLLGQANTAVELASGLLDASAAAVAAQIATASDAASASADAAVAAAARVVAESFAQRADAIEARIDSIAASFTIRTWAPGQSYGPGTVGSTADTRDIVLVGGVWYVATVDHEAGATFADDLAAGRWLTTDPVQLHGDLVQLRGDLATPGADKGAAMVAFLSTLGLSSTDAQAAIDEVFANTRKPRNIIHNAELRNLFRNGGGTPPTTLSAGQFLIDRWKAGSEGLTRPSASAINGEVEWSDGTLVQVLKDFGTNSAYPDGIESVQQVTFAWEGTAVGRINSGDWHTSPFTFATVGISPGPYLEFGIADGATSATMSEPRAAFGTIDPGFYPLPRSEAEPLLERYFQRVSVLHQFVAGAGAQTEIWTESHARMAAVPTPTYVGSPSYTNTTAATLTTGTNNRFYISMPSTAAGTVRVTATVELDTGL